MVVMKVEIVVMVVVVDGGSSWERSTKYCTCHEICTSRSTKYCHEVCTSRSTKHCTGHEICTSRSTKYGACHEMCTSRSTKYCTCHGICTSRPTKCCTCHEICTSRSTKSTKITKYCTCHEMCSACHELCTSRSTKYCTYHEIGTSRPIQYCTVNSNELAARMPKIGDRFSRTSHCLFDQSWKMSTSGSGLNFLPKFHLYRLGWASRSEFWYISTPNPLDGCSHYCIERGTIERDRFRSLKFFLDRLLAAGAAVSYKCL